MQRPSHKTPPPCDWIAFVNWPRPKLSGAFLFGQAETTTDAVRFSSLPASTWRHAMALTASGSKCEWCGRSFDGNIKPCSEASEVERRVLASTTTDTICKVELRERGF
jgi:hypothetical protein